MGILRRSVMPDKKRTKRKRSTPQATPTIGELVGDLHPKDQEELELERAVFGADFTLRPTTAPDSELHVETKSFSTPEHDDESETFVKLPPETDQPVAAWEDPDDDALQIRVDSAPRLRKLRQSGGESTITGSEFQKRLRLQHAKLNRADIRWVETAKQNQFVAEGSDSEDEHDLRKALETSESVVGESKMLPQSVIELQRLTNANVHGVNKAVVQVATFHPIKSLLLTAGFDCKLRLFNVDGKENALMLTSTLKDLPISSAHFAGPSGQHVYASGRRKFFYCLDLEKGATMRLNTLHRRTENGFEKFAVNPNNHQLAFVGNQGHVVLTDPVTQQEAMVLKASSAVNGVTFVKNGTHLVTVGKQGLVHVFDLRIQRCLHVAQDQGSLDTTFITLSPSSLGRVGLGSETGVFNVYDIDHLLSAKDPQPVKSLMNLTTRITNAVFHPKGEIVAYASHTKKNNMKLVHIPSYHVFKNWPTLSTPLNYVSVVDFSSHGGYMAVGNDKGAVLLYRLKHYPIG
eukprot:c3247_g1_i1.p1 GENE.c3247_g1_i1~~c3247_g1_i1.p1  ORF type:complete len:517 (-),score=115.27 c3247_g1_i1:9-1559(-)